MSTSPDTSPVATVPAAANLAAPPSAQEQTPLPAQTTVASATDAPTSKPQPATARPGPRALRLRYRVSLEDCRESFAEMENTLDFRIANDPDGLARLADQMKLLINTMAVEPLLTELNGWIRQRLEANRTPVIDRTEDDRPANFPPLGPSAQME